MTAPAVTPKRKRFGDPTQHPKVQALMVAPKGSTRGKRHPAVPSTSPEVPVGVHPTVQGTGKQGQPETPSTGGEAPKSTEPQDATRKAADAFAAQHPEGTKALLARLLREREAAALDETPAIDLATSGGRALVSPVTVATEPVRRKAAVQRLPGVDTPARAEPVTPAGMPKPEPTTSGAAVTVPTSVTPSDAVTQPATREAWLLAAVDAMRPWFEVPVPPVRISIGWPVGSGRKAGMIRGQCFYATDDKVPAIFVSPDQNDPVVVLGIVAHEMVHAAGENNHTISGFGKVAGPLGFHASFTTSANQSPELTARLAELAEKLGPLDHARVSRGGPGGPGGMGKAAATQTTRMVKVTCPDDGYQVRTTRKWLAIGLPTCPCGAEMVADADELAEL